MLRAGRLVQTATPSVLYRAPVDLDVARFVGDAVVPARARASRGRRLRAGRARAVAAPRSRVPCDVMIRPEQIRLVREAPAMRCGVAAEVVGRSYRGSETMRRAGAARRGADADRGRTFDDDVRRRTARSWASRSSSTGRWRCIRDERRRPRA